MLDIKGASAIVTGGASGLGAATARVLAERGAHVVVIDRQEDLGQQVAAEIGGTFAPADVVSETDVAAAVETAVHLAPLRAMVNCAGLARAGRTVARNGEPYALEQFEFVVRVNLIGTFNCLRLGAAAMAANEPQADGARGSILNCASVAAVDGQIGQAAYSASKAGIVGMTLPIARDLAMLGIRVNTILPGLFDTPIYGEGAAAEAFKAKLAESVIFPRRLGQVEEFAALAVDALTNSYLNGAQIRLDGAARLPPK